MGDHGEGTARRRRHGPDLIFGADFSHKTVAGGDGSLSESGYPALESETFIAPGGLIRKTVCQ